MKSTTSIPASPPSSNPLPPFLRETEPMELEHVPLQLALLTMEVAEQRKALERLSAVLDMASRMTALPTTGPDDGS